MHHKNTTYSPKVSAKPLLGDYNSVPEMLLEKADFYSKQGKEYYQIDAVTREKRYFSHFEEETRKIASALYKLGMRKGDMAMYMPSQQLKLHIFMAGVWRANGFCRASYAEDDAETVKSRLKEGDCKFILCDHNGIAVCKEAAKGVPWHVEIIVTEKHNELKSVQQFLEEDDGSACPPLQLGKKDVALILCTSGTTGPSKGAVYLHHQLIYEIHYFSLYPLTETKPNLLFGKGTHVSGSTFTFSHIVCGKTAIVAEKWTKDIVLKTTHELKPGMLVGFPTFILYLVGPDAKDYDCSSVEVIWTGGSIITPPMIQAFFRLPNLKDLINGYGLTESMVGTTTAIVPSTPEGPKSIREGVPDFSIGKPCSDTCIQIRDVDTLQVLGPNKEGEICIKSPGNFEGYFNNPEASEKAFVEGFFRTGDLGYLDENGFIYMKDRLKEIFKYYNNHISPSDIESVIGGHPNVHEVCVVGVPDPEGGGEIPRAFVSVKKHIAVEEIKKFAEDKLPNYKHLRGGIYILPELPQGKTGKVVRNVMAKLEPPTE